MLYFLRLTVFSKALLDASVSCYNYENIWFQTQYYSYSTISYDIKSVFILRMISN